MLLRLRPYLLLTLFALVFFGRLVLHPTATLYSPGSDLIAEHIPAKTFLVRSWRDTGELPLWCPDQFGGAPFVHDIQVALFYPPHWILLLLPPEGVGPALSWLVVAHVLLAGWCMYAYARRQDLGRAGAMTAAIGYMFAGKWLFHLLDAGHYILIGLAWLPLFLLVLESAIRRGSLVRATAAGAVFAPIVLSTQPQWTFYAALFAAAWTLGTALESAGRSTPAALGRWLGVGLWAAVVAGALSAVQLLPTLEAASQSSRGAGVPPDGLAAEFALTIHQLVGPSPLVGHRWEERAGLGVVWLTAAVLAPVLRGGRVRYRTAVWLGLWALALGGGALFQQWHWPGFATFKLHARILVLAAFPMALLAGVTTDALFEGATVWTRGKRTLIIAITVICMAAGVATLAAEGRLGVWEADARPRFPLYPAALFVLIPAAFLLLASRLRAKAPAASPAAMTAWLAVLLLDLWAMSWPLVDIRDASDLYRPSACVGAIIERREADPPTRRWRVLDTCVNGEVGHSALGEGCPLALIYGLEAVGGYSPLDVHRYRDYLQFVADDPDPMRPFEGAFGFPIFTRIPVRDKRLVDLLGVRYLLQPKDPDDQPDGHVPARPPEWRRVMEDDHAEAYDFTLGGVRPLPPYEVWENPDAFPRAFVVPGAKPLPERSQVLDALKHTDFRQTVLLEGWRDEFADRPAEGTYRAADVLDYRPNRIVLREDGPAGWLVLADVWFPGWTCTVNGRPADVHRADFLFRAVAVPSGPCEIVFTFEPESYRRGRELSLGAAALLMVLAVGAGVRRMTTR